MNEWEIQAKVEQWCRQAWNNMGLGALQGEMQRLRQEIAKCNQEMANARTSSTVALSEAKKAVDKAKKIVEEVADRMDDLEDEQAKFAGVIKEAKDNADKALKESEKKNEPIVIKTGEGWDYPTDTSWGWGHINYGGGYYTMQDAVNVAAQLAAQGVQMNPMLLEKMLNELDSAKDKLVVAQAEYNKVKEKTENENANN